jgi:hypothetical protein
MAMTLLGYRAMMAELRRDALRREAAAARKVWAVRAARRQRGSDMAALLFVAAVVIFAVVGGFLGADLRDGADWSPATPTSGERWVLRGP